MSDQKINPYQVGGGAGAAALIMFLLQQQGIGVIDKNQESLNKVAIERTAQNSERISRNEEALKDINAKMDKGFDSIRDQMRDQRDYIVEVMKDSMGDRWTKADHANYADHMRDSLNEIKQRIQKLEERKR